MSSLNAANIGIIDRGLVAMDCVVDVIRAYQPVLNEDIEQGVGGIPTLSCYPAKLGVR